MACGSASSTCRCFVRPIGFDGNKLAVANKHISGFSFVVVVVVVFSCAAEIAAYYSTKQRGRKKRETKKWNIVFFVEFVVLSPTVV